MTMAYSSHPLNHLHTNTQSNRAPPLKNNTGPKKPTSNELANLFMVPILEMLQELYKGYKVYVRERHVETRGKELKVDGYVLCVMCDGRAHECAMNVQQGGYRRCPFCEHEGIRAPDNSKCVYPPEALTWLDADDLERQKPIHDRPGGPCTGGGPPALRTTATLRCVDPAIVPHVNCGYL